MNKIKLAIIVAAARNGVIGKDNKLPWHLPQDLKYFKAQTTGKPVIMGRKTFESIGKPLPNRTNIIITRNPDWTHENVLVCRSLADAISEAKKLSNESFSEAQAFSEVMIIGGAEIYKTALPLVDKIYLTRIDADVEGDAWFPELLESEWVLSHTQAGEIDATQPHEFRIYDRKHSTVE